MVESVVIVITKVPYGHESVYGGLYTAIACLERDLPATVILLGDGVYSAMKGQDSEILGYPCIEDLFYTLSPKVKIYVHEKSMIERGIERDRLIEIVEVIDDQRLLALLREHGEAIIKY